MFFLRPLSHLTLILPLKSSSTKHEQIVDKIGHTQTTKPQAQVPVADLGGGKGGICPTLNKILAPQIAPPNFFKLKYFVCLYVSLLTNFVIFCTIST